MRFVRPLGLRSTRVDYEDENEAPHFLCALWVSVVNC
jgi:hypothetical protein